MTKRYEVKHTTCDCHPETCCCDPYTITCDGQVFTRVFSKKAADKIADALNHTFPTLTGDMTMRIIDDKPSPKVAKIIICNNCGVTLEYVKADTKVERRTDYTGDTDSYRIITCPACKEILTVEW